MMATISSSIGGLKHGEEMEVHGHDKKVRVRYESEQALGDDNRPAKGYTVGHFHVHGPGDDDYESFRHSPQGPTLTGAKQYAADRAAERVSAVFRDRR
jgi:hypothetical protein